MLALLYPSLCAAVLMVVGGLAVALGSQLQAAMRQYRGGVDVPAPPLSRANTVPEGSSTPPPIPSRGPLPPP